MIEINSMWRLDRKEETENISVCASKRYRQNKIGDVKEF